MNSTTFTIKFITPLLIHGPYPRHPDTIGLTGKALRGSWRFWFRAIIGGRVNHITKNEIFNLESEIFGSSDENVGTKFGMMIEPTSNLKKSSFQINFSRRTVSFVGFEEGCDFIIHILPRKNLKEEEQEILFASIWLWANLGAIGQRARRGFGSPVIEVNNDNNPFDKLNLPVQQEFNNRADLENYLKNGLQRVCDILRDWNKIESFPLNRSIYDSASSPPINPDFFILQSFKQIAVAKSSPTRNLIQVLNAIHGNNRCKEMGLAKPRKASPVFIRLHKIKEEFYPVITWSEPKNSGCARDYIINNCKCEKYLDGSLI